MSTATLGYFENSKPQLKILTEQWSSRWNGSREEARLFDVTLDDVNYETGLIVEQDENEQYLDDRVCRASRARLNIEYSVVSASDKCWREVRAIILVINGWDEDGTKQLFLVNEGYEVT